MTGRPAVRVVLDILPVETNEDMRPSQVFLNGGTTPVGTVSNLFIGALGIQTSQVEQITLYRAYLALEGGRSGKIQPLLQLLCGLQLRLLTD